MTDYEIIKALECCADNTEGKCRKCPFHKHKISCIDGLERNALDLINRQKAEIDSLEAEIDKQYEQAEADILGNISDGGTSCHWCIDKTKQTARAEAIKEFAERLKEFFNDWSENGESNTIYVRSLIDDLVGEMTGDQNDGKSE